MDSTADPFPSEAELSRQFPGYRILRQISQTAMSSVFLAEEIRLRRRVVLKVLDLRLANNQRFHERFRREVAIAAQLDHPNVIPVYASGGGASDEGPLYLVLRYVNGGDLGSLLRREGRFDTARTVHFISQMAAALQAAHKVGLVHRDVKPSNVLVDADSGHLYLCDFGIAKLVDTDETITGTNQFVGTPDYASPEQIKGGEVDRRTDVYALGCVLFQCLTGSKPFPRADYTAVLWAHLQDPPPRVSAFRPDIPSRVDDVVMRAMAKRPDDRYSTCAELMAELNGAIATSTPELPRQHGWPTTPPDTHPIKEWSRGRWRMARRRWRLVSAACGAILLAAAIAAAGVQAMVADTDQQPLDHVPATLRGGCEERDPAAVGQPGAAGTLACKDASGQSVSFSVFSTRPEMLAAYNETVRRSGVARGTGDCSTMTGAEHRYPAAGAPVGRLLCFSGASSTALVWTDDRSLTLARTDMADADEAKLYKAWSTWTGAPAFPAADEKALLGTLVERNCHRAPTSALDRSADVVAAVECTPDGEGADRVTYYRFAGLDGLRRSHSSHVAQAKVTSNVYCFSGESKGKLSNSSYTVMRIDVGQIMCLPGKQGRRSVIEWTDEPVLLAARAEGGDSKVLVDWWGDSSSPLTTERSKVMNSQSRPVFPVPAEQELLKHVPSDFRNTCVRPSERQIKDDVPDIKVAAVACIPPGEPQMVFYYRFPDVTSLRKNYGDRKNSGRDCDVKKSKAVGDTSYSISNKPAGRLWCGEPDDFYMTWTDEALKIQAFAYEFSDQAGAYKWWQDVPGPSRKGG